VPPEQSDSILQFFQIVPEAIPPMPADASALGTLPVAAFQYCEAIRTASSFGWYVFPPQDIRLRWDGSEVRWHHEDEWHLLSSVALGGEFLERWERHAPADLQDRPPPFLSSLFVPGIVQIWSGFLVSTAQDWSVLIRPPANLTQSHGYFCFEGLVETDRYGPCPLFVNIKLVATDREIVLPATRPLFQLQPLPRAAYLEGRRGATRDVSEMSAEHWQGFRGTIRSAEPGADDHQTGSYGAATRRRAKQEQP
jgi:Family of unknown function (DUF6065)